MKVKDIIKIKGFKLINGDLEDDVNFSINTNEINGKTIFIPLKGNTDGHDYIINGVKNGISGFLVTPGHDDIICEALEINNNLIIVLVDDSLKALQDLAREIRKNIDVPIIALTGSFGKTTQREMIYSVLKEEFNVLTTKCNLNNHIGMPLTLVNYNNEEVILLELGTNHKGEIAFLRDICKPNISLVTNVGTAHIGNFKRIKNTLKEKTSIAKGSEYFLRNMDDELLRKTRIRGPKIINYSINDDNISNIVYGSKNRYAVLVDDKKYKVNINSDVDYLINYSICAMKIGLLLGMDIKNIVKGISRFKSAPSRMEKRIIGNNILIDDCYNASYETMTSGLSYFWKQPYENKIVILGDILELGKASKKIHKDIADFIIQNNFKFDEIHLVGSLMKNVYDILSNNGFNVYYYNCVDEIDSSTMEGKSVYLKSSHGTGLYKLLKEN